MGSILSLVTANIGTGGISRKSSDSKSVLEPILRSLVTTSALQKNYNATNSIARF
jgi:hypothetical protein